MCLCDMNNRCLLYVSICFLLMVCGYQTCSKLEFIQGSEHLVSTVGSIVNITFYLDKRQCRSTQLFYKFTISRSVNGSHVDICKLRLENTCIQPPSPALCSCLSPNGPMLFSKKVSSDDNNTVYIWKWKDVISGEQNKEVTFHIYNAGTTTYVPDTTTYVPGTTYVPDTTTYVPNTTTYVPDTTTYVPDTTTIQTSIMIVISGVSSGGGVLLITGVILITAYVCIRRDRREFTQNLSPPHSYASSSIHCPAEAFTAHIDQTGDIYEQIYDPIETCTEDKVHSEAPSRSGVNLQSSDSLKCQDKSTSTLVNKSEIPVCQTYPDGYLHPFYLPGKQREQNVEFKTMRSVDLTLVKPKALRSSV